MVVGNRNVEAGEATLALVREAGGEGHFRAHGRHRGGGRGAPDREAPSPPTASWTACSTTPGSTWPGPSTEVSEEDWQRCIDTNLKSVFLGSRYALPHLIRNGGGTIINNSSNAGLIGRPNDPVYCASKHGIIGLTKSMALRHGPQNVRVNAICPGPIESNMMVEGREAMGDAAAFDRLAASQTALKRIAPAEEVAELVCFLASDVARNITGAAIPTDGGKVAGILPGLVPADEGQRTPGDNR